MDFWTDLVEPFWEKVSIYDGPVVFLEQYAAIPEASRLLLAATRCYGEVTNGGFLQLFDNSTGVLVPEAVEAFRKIGMPKTADIIEKAMSFLGASYPRERKERHNAIDSCWETAKDEWDVLDTAFYQHVEAENGGFGKAANKYAASTTR